MLVRGLRIQIHLMRKDQHPKFRACKAMSLQVNRNEIKEALLILALHVIPMERVTEKTVAEFSDPSLLCKPV